MKARDRSRLNRFLGGSETVLNKGVLKGSPPEWGTCHRFSRARIRYLFGLKQNARRRLHVDGPRLQGFLFGTRYKIAIP
jgi:hypothetical protein